ncbi:uncharacterized protein CEXT_590621 [Caerostris extrusa]|uniref:Gustatory receptor n=1 Tax=Caerostris extrusa TaxID=172846 RepID=A0AAV4X4C5_CAEEX|nr:uncharacterized protein CEXT_590621 [Caerostris extrusa]
MRETAKIKESKPARNRPIECCGNLATGTSSCPENFVAKEFGKIFILFSLLGIRTQRLEFLNTKSNKIKGTKIKLSDLINIPKHCMYVLITLRLFIHFFCLICFQERKNEFHRISTTLTGMLLYLSINRRRQQISRMTEYLIQEFRRLPHYKFKSNSMLMAYYIFATTLTILSGVLLYFNDTNPSERQKILFLQTNPNSYFFNLTNFYYIFQIVNFLFYVFLVCLNSLFAVYYILTCTFIRILFEYLFKKLSRKHFTDDLKKWFDFYGSLINYMNKMDEYFSRPAFFTVLTHMFLLFWGGYRIAFHWSSEYFLYMMSCGIYFLPSHLMFTISASLANETAHKTKQAVKCLLCQVPPHEKEIRIKFEKYLIQENNLTLWKIYTLDRSFIITSIATLITYGILIASLGNAT